MTVSSKKRSIGRTRDEAMPDKTENIVVSDPESPLNTHESRNRKTRTQTTGPSITARITPDSAIAKNAKSALVTPSGSSSSRSSSDDEVKSSKVGPRRSLFTSLKSVVTPSKIAHKRKASADDGPNAKRRLIFGKYVDVDPCQLNVIQSYKIIRKLTGSIGGNGYCGPIYGELTMGSMQKMIDLMMEYTNFNASSRFIDVGSGIGKPNIHVAQFPGCQFSCGVEMEHTRWSLGMTCLKSILDAAVDQQKNGKKNLKAEETIQGNCVFLHNNITEAKTFDPFTHVYMFSIGFPPPLWLELSNMFNRSQSEYLICYHSPKAIIGSYEFDVELIAQTQTSMHGSKEGHMGYIYRRKTPIRRAKQDACDELFKPSLRLVKNGLEALHRDVTRQMDEIMGTGRRMRSRRRQSGQLTRC